MGRDDPVRRELPEPSADLQYLRVASHYLPRNKGGCVESASELVGIACVDRKGTLGEEGNTAQMHHGGKALMLLCKQQPIFSQQQ